MGILLTASDYAQLLSVLVIFVVVLGVTAWTTKWIANYQKQQGNSGNIEIIETSRISNSKYLQIVRVGQKYMVIAVCKDTVTMLGEVPAEQLQLGVSSQSMVSFKELLANTVKRNSSDQSETKDRNE